LGEGSCGNLGIMLGRTANLRISDFLWTRHAGPQVRWTCDLLKYDTIIVGAGSAGAILAARLSEDTDRSVLLLEAGPDYPDAESLPPEVKHPYGIDSVTRARLFTDGSPHNWEFRARATDLAPEMIIPRGKVTGGSSAVNAQIFLRGLPEDYDLWAAAGNDLWSYQSLVPVLRRIESDRDFAGDFHGTDGPVPVRRWKSHELTPDAAAFVESSRKLGHPACPDANSPDSTGVGALPMNNASGVRWSTALTYLPPARPRLNLTIRANCLAHRVLFRGHRAAGMHVESGVKAYEVEAGEIILAAGAIGSPHLLLLSGVGPADQLRRQGIAVTADLRGVGRNLRDHPQVAMHWRTKPGFAQDQMAPRLQVALRYTATGSTLRNDMFLHPMSYNGEGGIYTAVQEGEAGLGMVVAIWLAVGQGRLELSSTDPHVPPMLDYNYLTERFDLERMREGVRVALKIAEGAAYRQMLDRRTSPGAADIASDTALDRWIFRNVRTSHHVSGTCKMGPASDPMAVVDQQGRVHGVQGLRVADASIMPDCIRANTNVTAMVIGEKVAEMVRVGQ